MSGYARDGSDPPREPRGGRPGRRDSPRLPYTHRRRRSRRDRNRGGPCAGTVVHLRVPLETTIVARIPETIPVKDLRQDTAAVLNRLQSSAQPLDDQTQRGRSAAACSGGGYESAVRNATAAPSLIARNRGHCRRRTRPRTLCRADTSSADPVDGPFHPFGDRQILGAISTSAARRHCGRRYRARRKQPCAELERFPDRGRARVPGSPCREVILVLPLLLRFGTRFRVVRSGRPSSRTTTRLNRGLTRRPPHPQQLAAGP